MIRNIFTLFIISLSINIYSARLVVDSTFIDEDATISNGFSDNLDSLLTLWYIQNSPEVINMISDDSINAEFSKVISFPDSFYINRLKRLPFNVPLTYNKVVRNNIEMYTQRKQKLLQIMLGLSDYYFPIFEDVLDYHSMPNELKYLPVIESALIPRARSKARAVGLWQFIYGTGKMYKLSMNAYVDERCDPIKSSHAAATFLKDLYSIFGDWQLAIAAYNCGPNNVKKAIRRSGGKRDFWEIYRFLPRETRGYVPAFIAAAYAMNYYKDHNLTPTPLALPMHTDTLYISENVHFKQISNVLNIDIELLRDLNPQYLKDIIPGKDYKNASLRLPETSISKFIDNERIIYSNNDSLFFDKRLLKDPSYLANSYSYVPKGNYTKVIYEVQKGDYLGSIAEKYNISVNSLRDWNNISRSRIYEGQKLKIYLPKKSPSSKNKTQTTSKNQTNNSEYYVVREGDTLWSIAQLYEGISSDDIIRLNNLQKGSKITPGQKLKIKKT